MKKHLFMVLAFSAFFTAEAMVELVPIAEKDIVSVERITRYSLKHMDTDDLFCEANHTKYKAANGNLILHTYHATQYSALATVGHEGLEVTKRFFAITTGAANQIFGLDVMVKGNDIRYDLLVSCKGSDPWSVEVSTTAPADDPSRALVKAFCADAFKTESIF